MLDINTIRTDFPILNTRPYGHPLVYLDNAATTQKPRAVLDAMSAFYSEHNANIHRGTHYLSNKAGCAYEQARETVCRFINARSTSEVVFTSGTTASINLTAHCSGSRTEPGDEILISAMEHHSNIIPWQMLCRHHGARLRVIPLDENGSLQLHTLDSLLNSRTRILALTLVSNVLGTVNPVKDISAIAHSKGIPVLVDAAQAIQHMPIDVQDLDCDFLAFSGHKVYAGTGIGVLYAKAPWLSNLPPYQTGGGMIDTVDFEHTTFAQPPAGFEAGTPNIAGAVSLHAALEYIRSIGIDEIAAHEQKLVSLLHQELSRIPDVAMYGSPHSRCGVIPFNLKGIDCFDAALLLDKMGIALRSGSHCAQPLMKVLGINGTIRASVALYNTVEEIEILVHGLRKVLSILG